MYKRLSSRSQKNNNHLLSVLGALRPTSDFSIRADRTRAISNSLFLNPISLPIPFESTFNLATRYPANIQCIRVSNHSFDSSPSIPSSSTLCLPHPHWVDTLLFSILAIIIQLRILGPSSEIILYYFCVVDCYPHPVLNIFDRYCLLRTVARDCDPVNSSTTTSDTTKSLFQVSHFW